MGSLTGKPELAAAAIIDNDGFWPNLSLGELMAEQRIPAEYDTSVIINELKMAMVRTNSVLKPVKSALVEFESLEDAAQAQSGYASQIAFLLYKNAVFARAKARCLPQFNTINRRPNAENAAKTEPESEDGFMADATESVAELFVIFGVKNGTGNFGNGVYCSLI